MPLEDDLRRAIRDLQRIEHDQTTPGPTKTALAAVAQRLNEILQAVLAPEPPLRRGADEWVAALLHQAGADVSAAAKVAEGYDGEAHELTRMRIAVFAMLLQMVFEKVSKAALARSDFAAFHNIRKTHATASRMLKAMAGQNKYLALRRRWKIAFTVVRELERAHPALAREGPHLEYPWELPERVALPATDLSVVATLADSKSGRAPELLRLADELIQNFNRLF